MNQQSELWRRRNDYVRSRRMDIIEHLANVITNELDNYYMLDMSDNFEGELIEFLDQQMDVRL